ncbi:MAG: hypothetical protein ABH872_03135 [Candidatus Omnitrophota bacterium]
MIKYSSKKSLTFIELLLVTVIISIFLGLAAPLVRNTARKTTFKSFVNKIFFFLDYARSHSIVKNEVVEAVINLDNNTITLISEGSKERILKEAYIPDGINVDSEIEKIYFFPDGSTQEFEIFIYDGYGGKSYIVSKGFDGKIRIEKEPARGDDLLLTQ